MALLGTGLKTAALFGIAIAITGCKTMALDPYTREEKASHATEESIKRGMLCGGLALLGGGAQKNNMAGAALMTANCALAGALDGHSLDKRDEALLKELDAAGVKVALREKNALLEIDKPVTYAHGSSRLDGQSLKVVQAVAKVLLKYGDKPVDVIGHTAKGEHPSLAKMRAAEVMMVLSRNNKFTKFAIQDKGDTQPVGDNTTETGRERNRRVNIFIRLAPNAQMAAQ